MGTVPEESNDYFATRYLALKKVTYFLYSLLASEKSTDILLLVTFPIKNVTTELKITTTSLIRYR